MCVCVCGCVCVFVCVCGGGRVLVAIFRGFSASASGVFVLAGGLGAGLSFYGV